MTGQGNVKIWASLPPSRSQQNFQENQPGPFSLVKECRGLALIGRELHGVATPALAGSLWHKG